MKKQLLVFVLALAIAHCVAYGQQPYSASWPSLLEYETPEWYRDAKFGIFIHWGPTTVPAFESEWYGYHMYKNTSKDAAGNPSPEPSRAYKYHVEHFGKPEKYGYTKFIPQFKAKKFDPKAWVDLFVEAGAKYVVPVGEHCDGFAMYNSNITRWNAVKMGPKRDILGELFAEARKRGLKTGTSSHFAYGWHWWTYRDGLETMDPKLKDFYWEPHDPWSPASEEYVEHWYNRSMDMMAQYKPDLFWFDLGICEPEYQGHLKKLLANYYNQAAMDQKEVVFNYKNINYKPVPDGAAVMDVESGKLDRISPLPWQTDMSLGGWRWGYCENYELRPAATYVQDLIDIVSKNGCLLLNVAPDKDGVISAPQQAVLRGIGQWLQANGAGIYGTRPFKVFGQGPSNAAIRLHSNINEAKFGPKDIRYTQKGQKVYAFWLKPNAETATLNLVAFGKENHIVNDLVKSVKLLDGHQEVEWEQGAGSLVVHLPNPVSGGYPVGLEIQLEDAPSDILKTK